MDCGLIYEKDGDTVLLDVSNFSLEETLDCGQCFRWTLLEDGSWQGIVRGEVATISLSGGRLTFHGAPLERVEALWLDYFDFHRDYNAIKAAISADPVLAKAAAYAPGIRVLRQDPWEALCSFILSQNNNIPRIKGLVDRLCACFGEQLGEALYAFPGPERLAALSLEDLSPVRAGFRAKYILDAARRVAGGELNLEALRISTAEEASAALRTIHGVGPKVADCALLYGLGKVEAVPADVWIKRALAALYPDGFPREFAPFAGIAQQYLFHYVRHCPGALPATLGK